MIRPLQVLRMMGAVPLLSLMYIMFVIYFTNEDNMVTGCGTSTFTSPSGVFQSPGYPDADDKWTCRWVISLSRNTEIELLFEDFDLLDIFFCTDKLEVLNNENSLGTYKENTLKGKSITVAGKEATVILKTCSPSLFFDRRGIKVSYTTPERLSLTTAKINQWSKLPERRLLTTTKNQGSKLRLMFGISSFGVIITIVVTGAIIFWRKKQRTLSMSLQNSANLEDLCQYEGADIGISNDSRKDLSLQTAYSRNILEANFDGKWENNEYEEFDCTV